MNTMKTTVQKAYIDTVNRSPESLLFRASRRAYAADPKPLDWPAVAIEDEVEILEDCMGYVRHGAVAAVNDDSFDFRPAEDDKRPNPMPPIEGEVYPLPSTGGHAHYRPWKRGSVVKIHDNYYRVVSVKSPRGKLTHEFKLCPATEELYRKRRGRTLLKVRAEEAESQIGKCIQIGDEWLEIKSIEKTSHSSSEHDQVLGYKCYGIGKFTTAEKAQKLNTKWQLVETVRLLEQRLRITKNADSEKEVKRLEVELARVKRLTIAC